MPVECILDESTFVSNALLTINNCTPYNAVYGRVPIVLPDIDQPDAVAESPDFPAGTVSHVHRLREIAVQANSDWILPPGRG